MLIGGGLSAAVAFPQPSRDADDSIIDLPIEIYALNMKALSTLDNEDKTKPPRPDFTAYKEKLVATKVMEINDIKAFVTTFTDISSALLQAVTPKKQSTLELDTLSIWFRRGLQLMKLRCDFTGQFLELVPLIQIVDIFSHICQVYETGNGPFANAALGLLSRLLQFTNKLCTTDQCKPLACQLSELIMAIPPIQKSFWIISETFIKEMDDSVPTLSHSHFPERCMEVMWSSALDNSASKAFASYFTRLRHPQSSVQKYIEAWTPLVEKSLKTASHMYNVINHLLPKLFRPCPNAYFDWLKSLGLVRGSDHWRMLMPPLLNCANAISLAIDPVESGVITATELRDFLQHSDERCRLDSLALACSAISATRKSPQYALDIVLSSSILQVFFVESTSPEARSEVYSLLRRALLNCRDFIATHEKRLMQKPNAELIAVVEDLKVRLHAVFQFAVSLIIPDSSYTQLTLSTEFLRFFIEFEFDGVARGIKELKACPLIVQIYSPQLASTLLRFVSNNYDDIRLQCAYMLSLCPFEKFEQVYCQQTTDNTLCLLSSLKGRQSDGGAKVMKCVAEMYMKHEKVESFFDCLHMVLLSMNNGIQANLPVHGHFTAFGEIFSLISPQFYEQHHSRLDTIVSSLLYTSIQTWGTIKPQITLSFSETEKGQESGAWRSVKENSYLLKILVNFNVANQWKIFDHDTFLSICDLLMDQLANISHKGAFSAVHPTFVRVCELCYATDLENKPLQWLEVNLKLLETKQQFISRRSAGVPFLLTAILNSCVSDQTRLDVFFERTFTELFRISQIEYTSTVDEKNDVPQVHAFNCMQCICKEPNLGLSVLGFIEKAMEISLANLDHFAWAIKNGAVMLFTALQERLFESHNMSELTPSRNAFLFFNKYASLKESLLHKLEHSQELNVTFLVLSILLRLQTLSNSDHSVDPFVDIIIAKFVGHRVWKIREMAAQLLCMMTHVDAYAQIVSQLMHFDGLSRNEVHGRFLCLLKVAESSKRSHLDPSTIFTSVENWFLCATYSGDWINKRAALLILMTGSLSPAVVQNLKLQIQAILSVNTMALNGPMRLFQGTAVTGVLSAIDSAEIIELSKVFMITSHYEAQLATVEFWMEKPESFKKMTDLHILAIDVINNENTWNHVRTELMKLMVRSEISIPKPLKPLQSWSDSMKILDLVLEARLERMSESRICDSAVVFATDSMPEDTRLLALLAGKSLLTKPLESESVAAMATFLVYEKLSDDSSLVRSLACVDGKCAEVSKSIVLDQVVSSYPNQSFDILLRYVENSITINLRDLQSEKESSHFEMERSNLHKNEVSLHVDLTEKLSELIKRRPELRDQSEKVVSRCIASVKETVEVNEALISSWSFNVHLDSAIRKVVQFGGSSSEENRAKISALRLFLEKRHYYI